MDTILKNYKQKSELTSSWLSSLIIVSEEQAHFFSNTLSISTCELGNINV
jgi:hypothetical protein